MIKNHVTSLELSKRLKECGVPQKSVFCWFHGGIDGGAWVLQKDEDEPNGAIASAFLASEIGEMLPEYIRLEIGVFYLYITNYSYRWTVMYAPFNEKDSVKPFHGEHGFSLIDAMTKLFIWLIENNHVKVEELK